MKNESLQLKERFFLRNFLFTIEKRFMISALKMNYEIYEVFLSLIHDT